MSNLKMQAQIKQLAERLETLEKKFERLSVGTVSTQKPYKVSKAKK